MKDYKEKYEQSLELMKDCIPDENGLVHIRPCDIFPELKESEDERIRKEIYNFLYNERHNIKQLTPYTDEFDRWLAWLEKQVEHAKFCDSIQVGDKVTRNQDGVLVNLSQLKRVAKPADKQGEQKPAETEKGAKGNVREIPNSAWSEEDELMLTSIIQTLKLTNGAAQIKIDWLKSLKERVQPKQEWSEEDEAMWAEISDLLWEGYKQSGSKFSWDDIRNWVNPKLKSIRPQNTWKPSDVQINTLWDAIVYVEDCNSNFKGSGSVLENLYNDLKKLREK